MKRGKLTSGREEKGDAREKVRGGKRTSGGEKEGTRAAPCEKTPMIVRRPDLNKKQGTPNPSL